MRKATLIGCMLILFGLAIGGCMKMLSETTISIELREVGTIAGSDFPGATIELQAHGATVKSLELGRGQTACEFRCAPDQYTVTASSFGRSTSLPVETTTGSTSALLNFSTIVIYGEILMESSRLPSSFGTIKVELLQDNRPIETRLLNDVYTFQFAVEPGRYQVNVTAGIQNVAMTIETQKSRFCRIDLSKTCRITGQVYEAGALPGSDWPGGLLRVETMDGITVQEAEIGPDQGPYEFMVKPGIYRIVADSRPRKPVSTTVDLSTAQSAPFQLDFDELVLGGEFLTSSTPAPDCDLTVLQRGNILKQIHFASGSPNYSLSLPRGEYGLEIRVPERGSLSRYTIPMMQSRRFNIDLCKTVSIRGQITENGLLPIPDQFPLGGLVHLRTKDGIIRKSVPLNPDGTFEARVFAGEYVVEALSEGRIVSVDRDATRSDQVASLDYQAIVLQGSLNWRDGGVPASFPETKVELKQNSNIIKSVVIPRGSSNFKAVLPPGSYSATLRLKDTGIAVTKFFDVSFNRSSVRILDISQDIYNLSGKVTAGRSVPSGVVLLNVADQHGISQKIEAMADGSYEAYLKKETYSIQLSCPSYLPAAYSVYVGGDMRKDLAFTHCNVACTLNLKTSLLDTDCHITATLNDYFKRDTPLNDILFSGATYLPPFGHRQYTFNVAAPIGETLYFQVCGIRFGAFVRWTLTPEQNCSDTRTIPVVLGG